jgi:outer membrane protein assembly factor BamB
VFFIITICYLQLSYSSPFDTEYKKLLELQYRQDPGNEQVKTSLRTLDLLARKVFFTQQWQIHTGGLILAFGLGLTLTSNLIMFALRKKEITPGKGQLPEVFLKTESWSQLALTVTAVVCIMAAGIAGCIMTLFSSQYLAIDGNNYVTPDSTHQEGTSPADKKIWANWPVFRGPYGNAHAGAGAYPIAWNGASGKGILWKTSVPRAGANSPIVWENRVYLSGGDSEAFEVYCFDTESGKKFWSAVIDNYSPDKRRLPKVIADTGYAAPTMATDGIRVVVLFATGEMAAFTMDGKPEWRRTLETPQNSYGHASSLMIYQERLLIQFDTDAKAALIGLDVRTGRMLWEAKRDVLASWSSPVIIPGSRPKIILSADPLIAAYDPSSGKEVWKTDCISGEVGPSPAWDNSRIYAVNQNARLVALNAADGELQWDYSDELSNIPSPLATDSFLFLVTESGVIVCLESKSGKVLWLYEHVNGFYASPVAVEDRIYALDVTGTMVIFENKAEFKIVAECELGEAVVSTPAFARGRIYIRGKACLYCIGN